LLSDIYMKKISFLLITFLMPLLLLSQEMPDSLLAKYNHAKRPIDKANILLRNLQNIKGTPSQRLRVLLRQLNYFIEEKDDDGIAYTQLNIGYLVASTGDFSASLKYGVAALKNFETKKDTSSLLSAYILISNAMTTSENVSQGLKHLRKSYPIAKKFHSDSYYYSAVLNNMADCFIKLKLPDSALPYIQDAVKIDYKVKDNYSLASSLCTLGETYLANKEYDIGRPFLRKSIEFAKQTDQAEAQAYSFGVLAESFYRTSELDSANYYAYRALHYANPDYKMIVLESYELLYKVFEKQHQQDSAFKYLKLATKEKDVLFSTEKNSNLQTLNFHEQLREEEQKIERQRIEDQRNLNIQYALAGVGIITLIILFLLLSHSAAANEKMVKIFSITGLLLAFEFLNLLLHPFLERITFHSPILMLLCLVLLAFLLIPAHHKLEKWTTKKLVAKNKHIRLLAAQKAIKRIAEAELEQ
jgi:tetratricopeptide (TPR) repeat protein